MSAEACAPNNVFISINLLCYFNSADRKRLKNTALYHTLQKHCNYFVFLKFFLMHVDKKCSISRVWRVFAKKTSYNLYFTFSSPDFAFLLICFFSLDIIRSLLECVWTYYRLLQVLSIIDVLSTISRTVRNVKVRNARMNARVRGDYGERIARH